MTFLSSTKSFSCTICKKGFKKAKYLKNHLKLHRLAPVFTCPTCKKSFTRKDAFKRHKESAHLPVDILQHGDPMVVHRHNAQDVQPPQSDLNVAGGSGTNIVEESQWTKYCAAQQDINSDRDSDGGEEEGSNILSLAEQARNDRLSDLSDVLAEYGRRNGENEAQIARMRSRIRERMIDPGPAPRIHLHALSDRAQGTVDLQLEPGVQYILSVPPLPQQAPGFQPPQSSASQPPQSSASQPSEQKYVCNICNQSCRDNFNLRRHVVDLHTESASGYACRRYTVSFLNMTQDGPIHVLTIMYPCSSKTIKVLGNPYLTDKSCFKTHPKDSCGQSPREISWIVFSCPDQFNG